MDPHSFILISAAFGVLCAFVFLALRSGFPRDIAGLARWGWSCALMAGAALLFALQGKAPMFISSFVPNLAVAAGVAGLRGSVRRFAGKTAGDAWPAALIILCAAGLIVATLVYEDFRLRVLIMSGALALLFASSAFEVWRVPARAFAERYTAAIFGATAAMMLTRFAAALGCGDASRAALCADVAVLHMVYMATFSFSIVALSLGFLLMVNRALQTRLESLASRDQLSGAYRREAFLALLDRELIGERAAQRPLCLLMMDLDNFKAINDCHGHLVGDRVIRDFSEKVKSVLRRDDLVGRYGGEEFLVLFPDTPPDDAQAIAQRILQAARRGSVGLPAYTVSIGMAILEGGGIDAAAVIDAADGALYAAKRSGKDRLELVRPAGLSVAA
ncbi:GGDEF domain-containing protein [Noviherbaspirillum pedocola]|uniref:diguanylate cyclase n=1 Tax=Noviherbaspirillum pedocola TaxID=2801341 RepID=A0A934W936_9BURK|nr:GGDEF domain-containing protein [Noviherbaspirillum pedocola]MBK4737563.1 GGDEF domain-containing protein [Noviherbaspirillum pedocola]